MVLPEYFNTVGILIKFISKLESSSLCRNATGRFTYFFSAFPRFVKQRVPRDYNSIFSAFTSRANWRSLFCLRADIVGAGRLCGSADPPTGLPGHLAGRALISSTQKLFAYLPTGPEGEPSDGFCHFRNSASSFLGGKTFG